MQSIFKFVVIFLDFVLNSLVSALSTEPLGNECCEMLLLLYVTQQVLKVWENLKTRTIESAFYCKLHGYVVRYSRLLCFRLTVLCDWFKMNQCDAKRKPIVTCSHPFSRALGWLHVFASYSDWLMALF